MTCCLLQVRVKPINDTDNPVIPEDPKLLPTERPMIVFNHEDEDANEYTVELTAIDATMRPSPGCDTHGEYQS